MATLQHATAGWLLALLTLTSGCTIPRRSAVTASAPDSHPAELVAESHRADKPASQITQVSAVAADTNHTEISGTNADPSDLAPSETQSIDLTTALLLTGGRSPDILFASARVAESRARLERADALWLPSLRAGTNYNKHEGRIQDVAGTVFETSRGSVYGGFGASAVGAGSPAVPGVLAQFHVADAVFQPRIARQTMCARSAEARAARNDALLATALAYNQLLRSLAEEQVAHDVLSLAQELERVTDEFARAGQGLLADHDRARAELAMRQNDLLRAQESVRTASAALAQTIRWEYAHQLRPLEEALHPVELGDAATPESALVAVGLSHRPELAQARHLVCEAVERLQRERYAPLIPSVLLGVSYGGLAGGLGGRIENEGDRLDADAMAYWELRQLGLGDRAAQREASAQVSQQRTRQVALMDRVAREISEAHAQVDVRRQQIPVTQQAVVAAMQSYDRNVERIRNGQGLPIEVLQSIQALASARREVVRVIADHNAAQFTLHRALGWPIDAAPENAASGGSSEG
jgi:outer membrane protein TolC